MRTKEDFAEAKRAYYYFLNNCNVFSNTVIDRLIKRGVELGCLEDVLEIFDNHCFLRYYPHYDVTLAATKALRKTGDVEHMLKWSRTLNSNPLIKLNEEIKAEVRKMEEVLPNDKAKKEEFQKLLNEL